MPDATGESKFAHADTGNKKTRDRSCFLALSLVLVLATLLRVQHIESVGVSFDESFTMKMIEFSWPEMLTRISLETQPPLFYALLKLWANLFGNTILAGRIFTSLWGIAGVWAMFLFIREAYRDSSLSNKERFEQATFPALLAALILAMAPLQLFWTMQIRMYSMPLTLALFSAYFLMRALNSPDQRMRDWTGFTLTASLLSYTHYFGLFVLVAEYAFALGYGLVLRRNNQATTGEVASGALVSPPLNNQWLLVLLSASIVSLAYQPWLPYFLSQRQHVASSFYHPELSWAVWGTAFDQLWMGEGQPLSAWRGLLFSQISFGVLLIVLTGKRPGDVLITLCSAVPVACVLVFSVISHPIVVARYLMFSQLFLIAALAVAVSQIPLKSLASLALIGACGWLGWGHYEYRNEMASCPGINAALQSFHAGTREETLIVSNPMLFTSAIVYSTDQSRLRNYLPQRGFPFYQGTPVMREEEYITLRSLDDSDLTVVWTLDSRGRTMGRVPLSKNWKLESESTYREWFTTLFLRKYTRHHSPPVEVVL